jgi:4-hydroxy-tetrahydrodipicolinate synthase
MKYNIEGSWPALVTPFTDSDAVHYEVLRRLVGFHVEYQSTGILLMGSTGEAIMLTHEERMKIIDTVIDEEPTVKYLLWSG